MTDQYFQSKRSSSTVTLMCRSLALFIILLSIPDVELQGAGDVRIDSISIGFDGKILLGRWVPFTIEWGEDQEKDIDRLEIETIDGDAVPVRYWNESSRPSGNHSNITGLVRFGRASGVTIRAFERIDEGHSLLGEQRISLEQLSATHSFLPGTTQLTLVLGVEDSNQLAVLELEQGLSDEVALVTDFTALPDRWIGYESVKTLLIAPQQDPAALTPRQSTAIEGWVRQGGKLLATNGNLIDRYFGKEGVLSALNPGNLVRSGSIADSGAIELLVGSTDQLVVSSGPELTVMVVEDSDEIDVAARVGGWPLIVHRSVGFGKVSFVALDFLQPPLSNWSGRRKLLSMSLGSTSRTGEAVGETQSGRVSHNGYTDLAGQLRAGMDQYNGVAFVTFTFVALLVVVFILAIGPGDYLFLRRVTGRMELTWITGSLLCLAFCGLAWLVATMSKSSSTELNQVEIIDVDASTGAVRGFLWANLYSPRTGNYELDMPANNSLFGELNDAWLGWQGLPGQGLGSMQSRSDLGLYRQPYQTRVREAKSDMAQVPMHNASTKSLSGRWSGQWDGKILNSLRQSANSDALLGTVTNPLNVKLYDCVVLYGGWVYVLEERPLDAGETIVIEDDLRERTVAGYFTRLGGRGSDEVNVAWDPADPSLARIVQMMAFFHVIGGEPYTRMTNDFHSTVDLSHQLKSGNAILMGQVRKVTTPLNVNGESFSDYDKKLGLIRFLYPVRKANEQR